jgi:DNA-binding MarR family transcriptional regulator
MTWDPERLWRAMNPPPPYYDVRGTMAFGLVEAHRALRGYMAADRERLGLFEGRDLVLLEIARLGSGATPKRVQNALRMTPSSLSTVLRRSTECGYLTRERHPADHRSWRLELTTTGQAATWMAATMWRDADKAMATGLTESEVSTLGRLARLAAAGLRRGAGGR